MKIFLSAATLGRGSVPRLPDDVRRHVWTFTYPRPVLWCAICGTDVLVRTQDWIFLPVNTHPSIWADTPRCMHCA